MTTAPRLRRQDAWDALLGGVFATIAVTVHLSGSEAVSANREPGVFSVLLTVLAVGPLVVRRRYPVTVLALTLVGLLLLVATRNTVGAATLGCTVAFYTAVSVGTRSQVRVAQTMMVTAVAVGLLLRPVDLSRGGAVVNLAVFTVAWVLATGVRQSRDRSEADVRAAQERAARTAADERLRITRELHDIIGHSMSLMVVQAGVAERLLDTDPERARTALLEVGATGRASLAEMRQVLGVLRRDDATAPDSLPREPMPSLAALPELVAGVEAAGLPVTLVVTGSPASYPPGLELAAYRVVQEALTNCLKHSGARQAAVEVSHATNCLSVLVTDDGVPPPPPAPSGQPGQGLVGMRERVEVHQGRLEAGALPQGGFRVAASFPLGSPATTPATTPETGP